MALFLWSDPSASAAALVQELAQAKQDLALNFPLSRLREIQKSGPTMLLSSSFAHVR
jgi:hypothetical protein